MTKRIFRGSSWMAVLVLAIGLVAQTAWAKNPRQAVYVIGDSLSDPGNLYDLTGYFPPSPPYAYRFSNGPVWAEYFANMLRGVKVENLAYGGAFTGEILLPDKLTGTPSLFSNYVSYEYYSLVPPNLPGVKEEVEDLLDSRHPMGLNPEALYVVWAGANDVFAALENPLLLGLILSNAARNIAREICHLSAAGARYFAVGNLPDLGLTPSAEGNREALTRLSAQFNRWLGRVLAAHPCAKSLVIFDVFHFIQDVVSNPASYGLKNVTTPCIPPYGPGNDEACAAYLFWDTVHPTTYAHSLIADYFRDEICDMDGQYPDRHGYHRKPPPIWRNICYGPR